MAGSLQTGDRRVRPRLGSRHGTPLASRGVPGERGHLSSCIWNLGLFPDDARASHCPFVLTSFTGWTSERCPGIGFFSRGDREIGVLRNVEAPTRPRLECRRETGLILRVDSPALSGRSGTPSRQSRGVDPPVEIRRGEGAQRQWCRKTSVFLSRETRMPGKFVGTHQGCQVPFRPPIPNVGLVLRRCSGKWLNLAMTGEPRGFSKVAEGFSSYDGEFTMPLVLAQGSPIFHSSCEGKLGIALEFDRIFEPFFTTKEG